MVFLLDARWEVEARLSTIVLAPGFMPPQYHRTNALRWSFASFSSIDIAFLVVDGSIGIGILLMVSLRSNSPKLASPRGHLIQKPFSAPAGARSPPRRP